MVKFFYKLFLAFSATYFIIIVYLIKEHFKFDFLNSYSEFYSWTILFLISLGLSAISFLILFLVGDDSIAKADVVEIEMANNSFLPTYLGYFFVSLGISDMPTLLFIFIIVFLFTLFSQSLYFNPIFLLFGYQFYFIKNVSNQKIFLITRRELKTPGSDDFDHLKRINDYTFIEI